MPAAFQASASNDAVTSSNTSATITLPTWSVGANDWIVVLVATGSGAGTATTPSGYTQLTASQNGSGSTCFAFHKQASGGDSGASLTVTLSANARWVIAAYVVTGTAGFDSSTSTTSSSRTPSSAALTTVASTGLALQAVFGRGNADGSTNNPSTAPSGYSNLVTDTTTAATPKRNTDLAIASAAYSGGSVASATWTLSVAQIGGTYTVALADTVAGGGTARVLASAVAQAPRPFAPAPVMLRRVDQPATSTPPVRVPAVPRVSPVALAAPRAVLLQVRDVTPLQPSSNPAAPLVAPAPPLPALAGPPVVARSTADPVLVDVPDYPVVSRAPAAAAVAPAPWTSRVTPTDVPAPTPVDPVIAPLVTGRTAAAVPVVARSSADVVPDVHPQPLVGRAVPASFTPAPFVDRITADPAAPDVPDYPLVARVVAPSALAAAPVVTRSTATVAPTDVPTLPLVARVVPPPAAAPVPVRTTPAVPTLALWRFASTSPTYADPAVTVSAIAAGPSATATLTSGISYPDPPTLVVTSSAAGSAGSLVAGDYVEFTVTPAGAMDLYGLAFQAARGGASAPRGVVVRSSVDGFTADLFSSDLSTVRPNLAGYAFALPGSHLGLTAAVTFRIFTYSTGAGTNVDIDDLAVLGVATTSPRPGGLLLARAGVLAALAGAPVLTRSTADPAAATDIPTAPLVGRALPVTPTPVPTVTRSTSDPAAAAPPVTYVVRVAAAPAAPPVARTARSTADPVLVETPDVPVVVRVVPVAAAAPQPFLARSSADQVVDVPTAPVVSRPGSGLAAVLAPFLARSTADPAPPPNAPQRPVQPSVVPAAAAAPVPVLARAVPEPADVPAPRPVTGPVAQVLAAVQLVRALLTGPRVTDPSPSRPPVVVTAPPRPAVPTVPAVFRIRVDNSGVPVYAVASTPPTSAAAAGSAVLSAVAAAAALSTAPAGSSGTSSAPSGSTPPASAPTAWGG